MPEQLPLFPLGTVLLPGLLLPLHVFEERYRILVRDLLQRPPEERRFGVVAIRQGREVGVDGVASLGALHEVGCVARVRRVDSSDDGRFGLVTTGAERFRLTRLVDGAAYLVGEVEWLADVPAAPETADPLAAAVRSAFLDYRDALTTAGQEPAEAPDLPADPLVLSYLVAATVVVDLDDRQRLLAEPEVAGRLSAELRLLRRETALLRALTCAPAPELTRGPISPN